MDIRAIETLLHTHIIGRHIIGFDSVNSTNDKIRVLIAEGANEGLVLSADEQTDGRGRFQRTWVSTPRTNLLFSVFLQPALSDDQIPLLNFAASLAVARTLRLYPGLAAELRWPNDVFVHGKKISGILSERTGNAVIIGIGVNVNQDIFPAELPYATSCRIETGMNLDRGRMFHLLLRELDDMYQRIIHDGFAGVMEEWRAACRMVGTSITLSAADRAIHGTVARIDDDGALVIRDEFGVERVCYEGDVSLKRV